MEQISDFSKRLKEYMDKHDRMTYEELSKITDIPAQTLNRYVLGQRIPKIDVATQMAKKLNISPLWLQGFDVSENVEDTSSPADISDDIDSALNKLTSSAEGLMFCGKPLDNESKRLLALSLEHVKQLAAEMEKRDKNNK